MFTPFILFLGLTVATAVIAHWSDNLGKKLGKKRVSLFGLRPRTTATILTVASSWGIMLFTLAALLIFVVPLRRSLFFYDRDISNAKSQFSRAQAKLSGTQSSLSQTQTSLSDARSQLSGLQTSLYNINQKFNRAQKATDAAQKANDAAQKRADAAQKRERQAQQSERIAAQSADRAAQEVENARGRLETIGGRLNAEQKRLGVANRRLATTNSRLGRVRQKFQSAQSNYARAQSNYARAQSNYARAQGNYARAAQATKNIRQVALILGPQVLELQSQANRARADVALLLKQRTDLLNFAAGAAPFVNNDAPIKIHQFFAERVIAANQTPAAIATQLRQLLRQGQKAFAASEEDSPVFPPDAKIQLLPLTGTDANGKPTLLEGERLLQRLAGEIASSGQTTSIRLIAPRNYLANEKIIEAIFVAIPIAPAFAEGEILASATIDGAQGDARVFRSLLDLTNLGRREAEKRGVNPPELFDETSFYANDTNVQLLAAMRFITDSKARLRVNLVTAKALSTIEPLKVRFEIESGVPGASSSGPPSS